MQKSDIIRVDKIKWWIFKEGNDNRIPIPLCPQHNLQLTPKPDMTGTPKTRQTVFHSSQ